MMSLFSVISLLLLLFSLTSAVNNTSLKRLPLPKTTRKFGRNTFVTDISYGPKTFAFDSTGKGFYTGTIGGKILKYTPDKGYVDFAYMKEASARCYGRTGNYLPLACGNPVGIAFSKKTGDLYIADEQLGLQVVSAAGGIAVDIDQPFKFLNGLDVDPTTGVVYFTARNTPPPFSYVLTPGNLYKYDPSTKVGTLLMEGRNTTSGCAVSSDGSFVLVGQLVENNIKKYWIKGPKAGSSENFTNSIISPHKMRRIGSTDNFWVTSVGRTNGFLANQAAIKVNSNGEVLQTILLQDRIERQELTEVNESEGSLYIGTQQSRFVRILKL